MRNEGSKSETDAESVRRIMETIQKVTTEFRGRNENQIKGMSRNKK